MLFIRRILIAVITLLTFCISEGQAQTRQIKTISGSEGLSDILVNTIYKDQDGYVWLGTEAAVDRFDGNSFLSFQLPINSRGKGRVNAILRVPSGDVYVGSSAGLTLIRGGVEEPQAILADKISSTVTALAADRSKNLYVATEKGLFSYDIKKNKLNKLETDQNLLKPDNGFVDLSIQDDNTLWAATKHTLYKYDILNQKATAFPIPKEGQCSQIVLLDNQIYIGLRGTGILPFNITTSKFRDLISFGNNLITDMAVDSRDNLYVATDGDGVFRYSPSDNRHEEHLSTTEGEPRLQSNSVYSIMADDLGLLWVGYYQLGLGYTPKVHDYFNIYSLPQASFDSKKYAIRAIAFDGPYKIIGTRDGLFVVNEASGSVVHYSTPQLRSNMIFCIQTMGDGRFIIGTYNGGMYELNMATGDIIDFDSQDAISPNTTVFDIATDEHNDLWVATSEGLIRLRKGKSPDVWTSRNSQLPEGNVYDIFFDSAGRGWFCTENGMALWDGETISTSRFPSNFIHKQKIRDIYEDKDHNLYFAPDRGSLFRSDLQLSKFGPVTFGSDEKVNIVFITEDDNDGWLWLGTDKGLIRYDKKDNFHHFNNADGLPGPVFTLCPPIKDAEGNIWMGNSTGLIMLDFERFKKSDADNHLPLAITNLMSGGKRILSRMRNTNGKLSLSLTSEEKDLIVYVSDFSYKSPENIVAEYFLEGTDGKWHRAEGKNPIHLYNLPTGDYQLKLRMQDDPRTETILTIHKSPEINLAMIAIVIMLLGAGCYILYLVRQRRKRRAEEVAAQQSISETMQEDNIVEEKHVSYKTTRLSDEECKRLLKALSSVMKEQKPYTNPDLKSSDLAAMIGTKSHSLSFLFNQYLKKSFYDYVNEYRVGEFKRLVDETDISRYTLTALSEKCGFSSRASFFRHFKAITGITPAEYIKQK